MTKMQNRQTRRKQAGLSMVELAIALVIVAILAGAAYFGFQANSRRAAVADNVSQITSIAGDLQKYFGRQNQYGALTTALAVTSRVVPEQLRVPGTQTAQNSYGGAITFAPQTLTTANDAARVTWPTVPQAQCSDLVVGVSNAARQITVAGVVVKPTDGALNLATLSTQCESALAVAVLLDIGR